MLGRREGRGALETTSNPGWSWRNMRNMTVMVDPRNHLVRYLCHDIVDVDWMRHRGRDLQTSDTMCTS